MRLQRALILVGAVLLVLTVNAMAQTGIGRKPGSVSASGGGASLDGGPISASGVAAGTLDAGVALVGHLRVNSVDAGYIQASDLQVNTVDAGTVRATLARVGILDAGIIFLGAATLRYDGTYIQSGVSTGYVNGNQVGLTFAANDTYISANGTGGSVLLRSTPSGGNTYFTATNSACQCNSGPQRATRFDNGASTNSGVRFSGSDAYIAASSSGSVHVANDTGTRATFSNTDFATLTGVFTKISGASAGTAAPAGTDCDAAGEADRAYWDRTNDKLYMCKGAAGWVSVTLTP